jgi:hypothetical protein
MSRVSLSLPFAALLLAGCVAEPPAAEPPPNTECLAAAAQGYVGLPASNQNIEGARIAAEAEAVRTIRPGQVVTMEFLAGRLNLELDAADVITAITCG